MMRTSLWKKLLLVFLGVYTCAVAILASFTYHSSRAAMISEFAMRGQELAKALAHQSREYYLRHDVEGFTNLLQALAEAQGVLAVLAYDRSGALWIEFSTIDLREDELALVAPSAVWHRDLRTKQGIWLAEFGQAIPAPIDGETPVGWIRLLLDRHPLEEGLWTLLLRTLIGSSFVALIGGTIFAVLLRRSLRVITSLTDATQQIAKGDLMVSVPVTGEDELGTLAECFNRMTSALHRTTVSKQYVDTIIASLLDSLIVVDRSGTIQTVNDATLRVLGYDRHELVGQPIETIFAAREPVRALETLLAGDQGETVAYREVQYRTKDGTRIPMLFSAGVMRDESGVPHGIVCAAQNMTEQKQAEAQWHRAHRLLQVIHQAQRQFIAAGNPQITFQALLAELVVLTDSPFGFIGERLVTDTGKPYLKMHAISNLAWDEETRARFQAQDQQMDLSNFQTVIGQPMLTGRPVIDNHPTHDPRDGSLPDGFPPLTAFLGIPFSAGTELVGMVALANRPGGYTDAMIEFLQPLLSTCGHLIEAYRNEQRRAEAEAALRASLERFDMAVKGSQDGIWDAWAVSADYFHPDNPVYYSPRFKELLGYEDEEFPNVVGSWISHLYPEDRDRAIQALVDHLQHGVPYNIEYRMFTTNGEVRWFAGRGQAIWDDHGRPLRISGSFRDITDRKRTEEALQEANRQLRALDHLRTQFFADISHELRTPLTVIRGEAEVTLRGGIKPVQEYRATLERIVELTKDVNKLVEDLLFLARTEAGTVQLRPETLHLQSLVQECAHAGGILAQRKSLTWSVALHAPEAIITGDAHRLKQALMIVIDNAVKYTEPGGILTLELLAHASWAEFTLADTGIGIHPDDLPHVFERFYRVTRRHMDMLSGAGLGLPIAKWIIDAHGGSIDIQSECQKGTTVRIRLPLTEGEHAGEHDAHSAD